MLERIGFLVLVTLAPVGVLFLWISWWTSRRNARTRRPFTDMPRPAGTSLQSKCEDLVIDYLTNALLVVAVGLVGWGYYLTQRDAVLAMVIVLPATAICLVRAWQSLRNASNHRLGLHGEQIVGTILDRLSSPDTAIFHDLQIKEPGKKPWNIDHVILTRSGVFAVETKARRKPRTPSPNGQKGHVIVFDGQQLIFPHPIGTDRHGLAQAQRNADWLAQKLSADNATPIPVFPLLVFPGWWIERKVKEPAPVLNEKQIASYLTTFPPTLTDQQFNALASQLANLAKVEFD